MSNLTSEKIMETWREIEKTLPPREPGLFDSILRPSFAGLPIYEAPPPPPKIQLREITFDDGTPILEPKFRARMNAWLIERFGFQEDIFKDNAYILGGYGIVVSPANAYLLRMAALS